MRLVDRLLDNTTMYRLVLYYLIALVGLAVLLSFLGVLPYRGFSLIFAAIFLLAVSYFVNFIFSKTFRAATNVESVYITALILTLIITPPATIVGYGFLFWAATLAMATKYILTWRRAHIFNPVAISVFLTATLLSHSASWWIGNLPMLPLVALGGFFVVRKLRRWNLAYSFLAISLLTVLGFGSLKGTGFWEILQRSILHTPMIFFLAIMLTEPLTMPPTKRSRLVYGALVGFLFAPQVHLGGVYSTPEIALLVGNTVMFLAYPKERWLLKLVSRKGLGPGIYSLVFAPDHTVRFQPGQYLELTLPHDHPDDRGNRRFFTIASSPTEAIIELGVKFSPESSSYKAALLEMGRDDTIVATTVGGDFTMRRNTKTKYVFVAGGIGITPYRAMLKYLIGLKQQRDVILIYSAKTEGELVYRSILRQAQEEIGLRTIFTLTEPALVPPTWQGQTGMVTEEMIQRLVPDYRERVFYLSGPHAMVEGFKVMLLQLNVDHQQTETDYFPGFA